MATCKILDDEPFLNDVPDDSKQKVKALIKKLAFCHVADYDRRVRVPFASLLFSMIWFGDNAPQDDCEQLVEQRMRVATRILKSDERSSRFERCGAMSSSSAQRQAGSPCTYTRALRSSLAH